MREELDIAGEGVYTLEASVTAPDGTVIMKGVRPEAVVGDPELWQPNGYGGQPLYTFVK